MIDWIKSFYNREELSEELYLFNIIHTICVLGMLMICVLAKMFFTDDRALYLCFGICVLFLLTMIEANRTGRFVAPVILMSSVFNFCFMPAIMFLFGRYICVIPIYFIFGILYSVMLLDVKKAIVIGGIESVFYLVFLNRVMEFMPTGLENPTAYDLRVSYLGAFVGTVIIGLCAGAAVRFRFKSYERKYALAERLKAEAMDAYVSKDMFLINMSHEIRTPMNAIVGNVDLLLDREVSEHVSDSVYNILNSCNALLSITDELMDLSKSESGEIELFVSTYDLSDLLMEVINMMTVRLTESNLDFFVDINVGIPKFLYGDSSKIRQVLVNVLNNAIKFTPTGKIIFRADYKVLDNEYIELLFDVEDTGIGIKKEDISSLFKRTEDKDEKNDTNIGIDGSGLGLVICSEILEEMKGSISVQSEYQKGSVFTVKIPQKFTAMDTVAYIPDAFMYRVLIFEKNQEYYEHVKKILDSFGIESDQARNNLDIERLMNVNNYSHIFVSNERYEECKQIFDERLIQEKIVAFLDIDDNVQVSKASSVLTRPIHAINIASLIKNETNSYVREVMKKGGFTCPRANVLIVDDNNTNLNVAGAIVSKYGAHVLTAPSGKECLKIVKEQDVDIIFLDYMMPELNGVDTLELIRKIPGSKFASLPIIALTANVVSGAREMFLEAGFDDFMSKPISVDRMERTLKKYLPRELIEYSSDNSER